MGDIMTVAEEVGSGKKKKKKEDERRKHTLHTEIYQPTSAILLSILHTFVDPPLSTIPVSSQEELPVRIDQSIVMEV